MGNDDRVGIVLAGGSGTRLMPLTSYVCKQLLPVYDKPMIYYPLYTLLVMGIKRILVISTPETTPLLENRLGHSCGGLDVEMSYLVQEKPNGLAQAFVLGEEFIGGNRVCLILGDNLFIGSQFERLAKVACQGHDNVIFGHRVADPCRYGIVEFDGNGNVLSIEEKPEHPKSNWAVPGIYFYNGDVVGIAKSLKPSARGEYEITDVNKAYLERGNLKLTRMDSGDVWMDCGTFQSLNDASNLVRAMEERTGMLVSDIGRFKALR